MNSTFTLIKMNIRQSLRLDREKSKSLTVGKWFITFVFILAVLTVFVAIYTILTFNISGNFYITDPQTGEKIVRNLNSEFFTFTFVFFHILQLLFLLPILLKQLKIGDDREILLRLPITSRQMLVSRLVTVYILEIIFAAVTLLPILLAFGIVTQVGAIYWGMIPVLLIIAPILPFLVGVILVVPLNMFINFIRSSRKIMLISYLVLGVLFVYLYMQVLTQASWLVLNRGLKETLQKPDVYWSINNIAKILFYQHMFANAIVGASFLSLGLIFISSILVGAIALVIAIYIYKYYYNQDVSKSRTIVFKTNNDCIKSPTKSYLVKEIKNITRSSNYIFQFLVFVVIMPIFVFMCARLAGIAAIETFKGSANNPNINPNENTKSMILGVTLLVFLIIVPLASSFAAISISREGGNIYQCKILPIGFRKQIMTKMLLCYLPILLSIMIGVGVVRIPQSFEQYFFTMPTTTVIETIWLFGVVAFVALGLVCMGLLLDIKNPICKVVGNGELTKSNRASVAVFIVGLIIALMISTPIILRPIVGDLNLTLIFGIFSVVFGVGMFLLLYFFCEKFFARVEGA